MKKEGGKAFRIVAYALLCLTGFLFLFTVQACEALEKQGNLVWTVGVTFRILGISLVGGFLFGDCIRLGGRFARTVAKRSHGKSKKRKFPQGLAQWLSSPRRLAIASFLLIFLAWLPAYLAYYPAICAYDMPVQTEQLAQGLYIDHHPIAHTFLLKCFMDLGAWMGSVTDGIGLFALVQLLFLALSFSWGITELARRGVRAGWLLVLQLFCMFFPFHWYMSISITKDTIFTAFFVCQLIALLGLLEEGKETGRIRPLSGARYLLFCIGMILFRKNGQYGFLFFVVVLALVLLFWKANRKFLARLLGWSFGGFLAGSVALLLIFNISGAEQGDKREMLSLPIQQLSRVMVYHGGIGESAEDDGTLDETSKALINDFILDEAYCDYDPAIADPVKRHTNTYVVRYRTAEFLGAYLHLFLEYPGDYLNAALSLYAGYLNPFDETHTTINDENDGRIGRGYVQTYWEETTMNERGIFKASKWPWLHERLEDWADANAYLKIPILKYLFVPGSWLWFCLLFLAACIYRADGCGALGVALIGGYFLTLFLGPTVQLRYLYPVMAALPFLVVQRRGRGRDGAGRIPDTEKRGENERIS